MADTSEHLATLTPEECANSIIMADGRWHRADAELLAHAYLALLQSRLQAEAPRDELADALDAIGFGKEPLQGAEAPPTPTDGDELK